MSNLKKKRQPASIAPAAPASNVCTGIEPSKVAELAVDLWKSHARARTDDASDRVIAACERAESRLNRLGFEIDTLRDQPYDTNMRVRVLDHVPSEGPLKVWECLSPAVYFNEELIREAEIVTKGDAN